MYGLYAFQRISYFFLFTILISCADLERIPKDLSQNLPNPVEEITDNDPYKIGLRWYSSGEFEIARKFWNPLAEKGDCDSQFALGLLYYTGRGVKKDFKKAIYYWSKAANQGQLQAQCAMGIAYGYLEIPYTVFSCGRGCGTEKNLIESYMWFKIIDERGNGSGRVCGDNGLEKINGQLSSMQILGAEELSKNWRIGRKFCKSRNTVISLKRNIYN